jgi:hypothetical protein
VIEMPTHFILLILLSTHQTMMFGATATKLELYQGLVQGPKNELVEGRVGPTKDQTDFLFIFS